MIRAFSRRLVLSAALGCSLGASARGQAPPTQPCDSLVAASTLDSVPVALYISLSRPGGAAIDGAVGEQLLNVAAGSFVPPRPFTLTVFEGPALGPMLRIRGDSIVPRAPTVTGVYRFTVTRLARLEHARVVRTSLMAGLDSAGMAVIASLGQVVETLAPSEDSLDLDLRISTDSTRGARRMLAATFPRMPVRDARALPGNPAPDYPDSTELGDLRAGDVVFRVVVDRDGVPLLSTAELVRATAMPFARAALAVLGRQRFAAATIAGCPVAQRVDYAFTFAPPASDGRAARH